MDKSGNFRRFILARVYITICCENAVDITIISADEHNALIITFGDDIANSAEFDATPILALIVSTEEDHDQLRPVAIDALEKCIQRWPSQLGNIVVIIEVCIWTDEPFKFDCHVFDKSSGFARKRQRHIEFVRRKINAPSDLSHPSR